MSERTLGAWWKEQEGKGKPKWKVQLPRGIATLDRKKDAIGLSNQIKRMFGDRCQE